MALTLVVLAAGKGTRFGRLKQLEPVGPHGSALMDYSAYDALRSGATKVVLVVPPGEEARFGDHARQQLGAAAPVFTVSQRLDDLPAAFTVPADRTKPWGTGHALLSAAPLVEGAALVANADDSYGLSAFRLLVSHLERSHRIPTHGLVGYHVRRTLSQHGGVSRAVCTLDADGYLMAVEEVREVQRNDPKAEFLIGTGVEHHVSSGSARLQVLPTDEEWFGMTFADDAPLVRAKIAELVERGAYPEKLSVG
jgi:hypothetical protein